MKKILYLLFVLSIGLFVNSINAMPNPWVDCGKDTVCGAKKAGFELPIQLNDYSVRAMEGLYELRFPLDKKREVILRKSQTYEGISDANGIIDISGDYNNYPVNKTIYLKNGTAFNVRGKKDKFYVSNFADETGYYSFYCEQGLKIKDLKKLYKMVKSAESTKK